MECTGISEIIHSYSVGYITRSHNIQYHICVDDTNFAFYYLKLLLAEITFEQLYNVSQN